jgi:hypothetical protein
MRTSRRESILALAVAAWLAAGCNVDPFPEPDPIADAGMDGGSGLDGGGDGGADTGTGTHGTIEDWIKSCEAATTAAECDAASMALPPPDCAADCWHDCSWSAFVGTTVDPDGGCSLGETVEACHYEGGGEANPWEIHDIPGCGTTRGEPAILERDGSRYTAFLPWPPVGTSLHACEYGDDGSPVEAECGCLCDPGPDESLACESGAYATCTDQATGLTWMRQSIPATGEAGLVDMSCEGVNWGDGIAWRAPTIDDLRTLVRDCPASATGGSCAPVPHPDRQCYAPRELGWPCARYWSATASQDEELWGIDFVTGEVAPSEGAGNGNNEGAFACVGEPAKNGGGE